ncbi:MAG: DUF4097 family beta strand repeat-containing protein [Anaerolineae bacterium]|jgi:hypothetical protein|nr:DUF4097 family beta strand repeat-containing protein [Anaerolineae bacterium]
METKFIKLQGKDLVIIKVSGNLFLEGYDGDEVRVQATPQNLKVFTDEEALRITCYETLTVSVPAALKTRVEKVGGTAVIRNIDSEEFYVQRVGGELTIQNTRDLRISRVGGACQVLEVHGDLEAERISGSLYISGVEGKLTVSSARSDVAAMLIEQEAEVSASGDVTLQFNADEIKPIDIRSKSDIVLMLPKNPNAMLDAKFSGWDVILTMDGHTNHYGGGQYEAELGDGGEKITLSASGDIVVTDEFYEVQQSTVDMEEDENKRFINIQANIDFPGMTNMERKLKRALEKTAKRLEKNERRVERAGERLGDSQNDIAQRIAERARMRAEMAVERAEMRVEKRALEETQKAMEIVRETLRDIDVPLPIDLEKLIPEIPAVPNIPESLRELGEYGKTNAPKQASREERMMILEMLQEGRISLEEAEKLLAALTE